MCGIFSIIGSYGNDEVNYLFDSLKDRGPDGVALYKDDTLCMGQTRLAIISSTEAAQFASNENSSIFCVLNGEIYNEPELKNQLLKKGHKFKSKIDHEVLIHAYEEWDTKFIEKLNGIFAFIMFDKVKNIVICGRDRFGTKPLYYRKYKNKIYLSSNSKSLGCLPKSNSSINCKSILEIHFRQSVNSPDTIYNEVSSLTPASLLIINLNDNNPALTICKYWDLWQLKKLTYGISSIDRLEEFNNLFDNIISRQLRSDRPIANALGGIDSLLIAMKMQKYGVFKNISLNNCLPTDQSISTLEIIEASESVKLDYEILQFPANIKEFHQEWISKSEKPPADGFNNFILTKLISKDYKVLLTGIGADELFNGYSQLYKYLLNSSKNTKEIVENYLRVSSIFSHEQLSDIGKLLGVDFRQYYDEYCGNIISQIDEQYNDMLPELIRKLLINYYLIPCLLSDSDQVSMMNGIELRVPYLDNDIIDFSLNMPYQENITRECNKYLIRNVSLMNGLAKKYSLMPKQGFTLPYSSMLKTIKGSNPKIGSGNQLQGYQDWIKNNISTWLEIN